MLAYETQSYLHGRIREHLRWTVFSFWAEFSQSNKSTDTRDNALKPLNDVGLRDEAREGGGARAW